MDGASSPCRSRVGCQPLSGVISPGRGSISPGRDVAAPDGPLVPVAAGALVDGLPSSLGWKRSNGLDVDVEPLPRLLDELDGMAGPQSEVSVVPVGSAGAGGGSAGGAG